MARNRVIGAANRLPWSLPEDLKRFRQLTSGHPVVMGRRTFESIGKALPGRTTVVVSQNTDLKIEGCIVAHSLPEAIATCAGDSEIFIVGGAELYRQAVPLVNTLYITEIQQDVDGDAHFPEFDPSTWTETSRDVRSQETPQPLEFHFVTYRKK